MHLYQSFAKPLLFKLSAERAHQLAIHSGELIGNHYPFRTPPKKNLAKTLLGITFPSPVGLSAGFDYEGRLTQILPTLGFGFHTIGTITNLPYEGNPPPILGRIATRDALIVNKGFKNLGADQTIFRLKDKKFTIPVGISIGKTNHKEINTQKLAIKDIVSAFKKFEQANLPISYYELNISCPNIFGPVTFYPPKNLEELLNAVDSLKIKKPLFVKMPITESNENILKMLTVITKHSPKGIIIGNLAKDPNIRGGLSGKPTFDRSNELISLTSVQFPKLLIIGTGGIFSPHDAKEKLNRGAKLVQLITGLVYEGPGLISDINNSL